jgi:hypothetical protein
MTETIPAELAHKRFVLLVEHDDDVPEFVDVRPQFHDGRVQWASSQDATGRPPESFTYDEDGLKFALDWTKRQYPDSKVEVYEVDKIDIAALSDRWLKKHAATKGKLLNALRVAIKAGNDHEAAEITLLCISRRRQLTALGFAGPTEEELCRAQEFAARKLRRYFGEGEYEH